MTSDMSNKTYPPNAGVCDRCGYGKTWNVKIPSTSGKMMPSHVDEEGHVLNGDGDCPAFKKNVSMTKMKTGVEKTTVKKEDQSTKIQVTDDEVKPNKKYTCKVCNTGVYIVGKKNPTNGAITWTQFDDEAREVLHECGQKKQDRVETKKISVAEEYEDEDEGKHESKITQVDTSKLEAIMNGLKQSIDEGNVAVLTEVRNLKVAIAQLTDLISIPKEMVEVIKEEKTTSKTSKKKDDKDKDKKTE